MPTTVLSVLMSTSHARRGETEAWVVNQWVSDYARTLRRVHDHLTLFRGVWFYCDGKHFQEHAGGGCQITLDYRLCFSFT